MNQRFPSKNKLHELPDSMRNLKSLKSLDVSHNQLSHLSSNILGIVNLEFLVVVGNRDVS